MITINEAAQALTEAGFKVQIIDNKPEGFVELVAHKDGFRESFLDADFTGKPYYLGFFQNKDSLVAYTEKVIALYKKQFS